MSRRTDEGVDRVPQTQAEGREERFKALAEVVAEPLHRYAVRRIEPEAAQDVVADAMLVLWRRLDDVPVEDPLPWCYAVARRCLANTERARDRQLRLVERIARLQRPEQLEPPPLADADLDAALRKLSEAERELVRLWAWEDLAPRQIAVVLGISPNAVSIRLHRVRGKLAALLDVQGAHRRNERDGAGQEQVKERRRR